MSATAHITQYNYATTKCLSLYVRGCKWGKLETTLLHRFCKFEAISGNYSKRFAFDQQAYLSVASVSLLKHYMELPQLEFPMERFKCNFQVLVSKWEVKKGMFSVSESFLCISLQMQEGWCREWRKFGTTRQSQFGKLTVADFLCPASTWGFTGAEWARAWAPSGIQTSTSAQTEKE